MAKVTTTTFIDPPNREPVTEAREVQGGTGYYLARSWILWLLGFVHRTQLSLCDSTAGPFDFPLPLAAKNQNVEVIIKKISADVNNITPVASGTDVIDVATPVGAQWAKARYISDGVSKWYLV